MEVGETVLVETRKAWRAWLARHHRARSDIWLISYKKGSGKRSLDYESAVEEALCYGWVDGQIKSMDAEHYVTRFSPRRPRSNWSESNRAKLKQSPSKSATPDLGCPLRFWRRLTRSADIPVRSTFRTKVLHRLADQLTRSRPLRTGMSALRQPLRAWA